MVLNYQIGVNLFQFQKDPSRITAIHSGTVFGSLANRFSGNDSHNLFCIGNIVDPGA